MTETHLTLVTGASRGLGYATAASLADPSRHIIAVARTVGGLEELDDIIQSKGGTATLVPLDITDEGGLQRLGRAIHDRWGRLDSFIHCAAHAAPLSPVGHISEKDFDASFAVNARALQRLITMLDPLLKAAPAGRALLVDDVSGAAKFHASYRASKAAARAIAETWALENAGLNLKVEFFTPNPMATALRARFYPGEDRNILARPEDEASRICQMLSATPV